MSPEALAGWSSSEKGRMERTEWMPQTLEAPVSEGFALAGAPGLVRVEEDIAYIESEANSTFLNVF